MSTLSQDERAVSARSSTGLEPAHAAALCRRIAGGDAAAETDLVERSSAPLRFLARRVTRSEADAEDLVQETLILALEKIRRDEIREPERLAGFLRGLLRNRAVQTYRRRHHAAEVTPSETFDSADTRPDPLGDTLRRERLRLTHRLLDELGVARDREILFRYYIAEESSDGICRDLELDADHFYRVLHRARQRYRELWRRHAPRELEGILALGMIWIALVTGLLPRGSGR